MDLLFYVVTGLLVGCALYASGVYFRAVVRGRRAYLHVWFATLYVLGVSALLAIGAPGEADYWLTAASVFQVVGIVAVLNLAGRFRQARR